MRNRAVNRVQSEIEPALKKLGFGPQHAILTEDGEVQPCSLLTWAYWLEQKRAQRIIKQEDLPHGYWISTVFLGLNHQYAPHAPPLWFECMVFEPSDGKPSSLTGKVHKLGPEATCQRYSTLKEAKAGHEMIKAKWLGYFDQIDKYARRNQ